MFFLHWSYTFQISGADEDKPKTEEERTVRQRVKEALSEGL